MKIVIASKPRGIALVIVMIAIFVLSILVGGFAYSMKVEMKVAQNANAETELIWLGRSGVERARWILAQQMSCPYDDKRQKWAGGPGGDCDTNGALTDLVLDNFPVGNGTISLKISDLESMININTAKEGVLNQALTVIGVDGSEIPSITSSIMDWIDADEVTHVNGAESDDYQAMQPPYYAKNKPIDDLSELLMVKGIREDPAIYWGPTSTNRAIVQKADRFGRPIREPNYTTGLAELFTSLSSGQVNINTASGTVISVLLNGDETTAEAIVKFRDEMPTGTSGMRVEDMLRSAGLNNQAIPGVAGLFTQRSSTFKVIVEAHLGNAAPRIFQAILRRNGPRDVQILSFHWD